MSYPDDSETVLVAGATGRTGGELLKILEETDYHVVGMSRSPDDEVREELVSKGADDLVFGDLMDREDAGRVVRDIDHILCTVGSSAGIKMLVGASIVDGKGVMNLIDAAENASVSKFVLMSSLGVGNTRKNVPLVFRLFLGRVLSSKDKAENRLRRSELDYTIFRPGGLTDDADSEPVVGENSDLSGNISRSRVAELMVSSLYNSEAKNRTFEVVSDVDTENEKNTVSIDWKLPTGESGEDS